MEKTFRIPFVQGLVIVAHKNTKNLVLYLADEKTGEIVGNAPVISLK